MRWRSKPSPLNNLKLAVERCHLNVVGTLFAAYASGLATLSEDEKQLGATVIDMGGGVTSIAVFLEGHLVHADVVPMGGHRHRRTSPACWRHRFPPPNGPRHCMARRWATWKSAPTSSRVAQMGEDGDESALRVPRSMLTRIIQARLEEIFGEVQTRLRASGFDVAAGRRAVLTGGACQLAGMRELAARVLNKQVRIGRPQSFPGLPAASAGPDYATAIGLLMAGATMPPELSTPILPSEPEQRARQRMAEPVDRQAGFG